MNKFDTSSEKQYIPPQSIYTVTLDTVGSKEYIDIVRWFYSKEDAIFYIKNEIKQKIQELNKDYDYNKEYINDLNDVLKQYDNTWDDGTSMFLEKR